MSSNKGKPGSGKSPLGKKPRPGKPQGTTYIRDDTPRRNHARKAEPSLPQTNKRLGEMEIERYGHDGRGIAQYEGKTVFVAGALVGERVTTRLVADHPRFIEARVDDILHKAPDRIEPP